MSVWAATIRQETVAARRERLPQFLLVVFIAMVAASAFIGSAAKSTVSKVYEEAVREGLTSAANPFDRISPLYYARNTVIYILLIAALLAIVIGAQSTLRDRRARTVDLVLSRDVHPAKYLAAKLAGTGLLLMAVLALAALVNMACIAAVTGSLPTVAQATRILALFGVAWLFLVPFVTLGMLNGIRCSTSTSGLLVPIVIWSVIVFILPLLGTAANPVSLLNPVPNPATVESRFFALTSALTGPLSLGEHFKSTTALILQDPEASGTMAGGLLVLVAFFAAGCAALLMAGPAHMRRELHG
jgi:ABC-2 type transport system permease protein